MLRKSSERGIPVSAEKTECPGECGKEELTMEHNAWKKSFREMLRRGVLLPALILLALAPAFPARAEAALPVLTAEKPVREGDAEICFVLEGEYPDGLEANVFSGEESLLDKAVLKNDRLSLLLLRPVAEGEALRMIVAGNGKTLLDTEMIAEEAENTRLAALEARIPPMLQAWQEAHLPVLMEGAFYLPLNWTDLPFVLYPDEAPELTVSEEPEETRIRLQGALPTGWNVYLSSGVPEELSLCAYDEKEACWVGSGAFDAVKLIRDGRPDNVRIDVSYRRENGYLAEYPTLEYNQTTDGQLAAFTCYGWGTARDFQGSMYGLVLNDQSFYAEYGLNHLIKWYWDGVSGCVYDEYGKLLEGEEAEGFVNPVILKLER